jgi:hypothetical protein
VDFELHESITDLLTKIKLKRACIAGCGDSYLQSQLLGGRDEENRGYRSAPAKNLRDPNQ